MIVQTKKPTSHADAVPTTNIGVWHYTASAKEVTAGVVIVPPVANKQFVPISTAMRAIGGTCSGPTTIRLSETTTAGVVHSQVAADMTVAAGWRTGYTAGGTYVGDHLGIPLTVNEGVKLYAVGGSTPNTAMTYCEVEISGFYI